MESKKSEHYLTDSESTLLLEKESIGIFATMNSDDSPYAVPMHYLFANNRVYMQTRPYGQKISNIQRDPRCSFAVIDTDGPSTEHKFCLESSVVKGKAKMITDENEKLRILKDLNKKYKRNEEITIENVRSIGVIEIVPDAITGKQRCMI